MSRLRPACSALMVLGILALHAPARAAQALTPDEKEIAAYRLTMPTVRKVMTALQNMMAEVEKDPKRQEHAKLKAQIKALEAKDELTEAQEAELEKLREREEALESEIDRDSESQTGTRNMHTLAEMEAHVKRQPIAARALAREGITPREYALCMTALLQAGLAEGLSQGKADLTKLPPGINPDNVRFVREHKAELEAMQKAMAGGKKPPQP